jgi:hypothetical protein
MTVSHAAEDVVLGGERQSDGLWLHRGKLVVRSALELQPPLQPAGGSASLVLPNGSVSSAMLADGAVTSAKIADGQVATVDLAANAAQQLVGSWMQGVSSWSTTVINTWLNTAVYANVGSTGGTLRVEFDSTFQHTAAGGQFMVGLSIDTVASPFVYWYTQSNFGTPSFVTAHGTAYSTGIVAGAHTVYLVIFNYSAGTLSQYGSGYHTLFVTEQKR